MSTSSLSTAQLREALNIQEQIEALQQRFNAIIRGNASPAVAVAAPPAAIPARKRGKRKISAEGRARIAAAQRERWARQNKEKAAAPAKATATPKVSAAPAKKAGKRKGGLTEAGRAKLAAMMKARWAARRKAGAGSAKVR